MCSPKQKRSAAIPPKNRLDPTDDWEALADDSMSDNNVTSELRILLNMGFEEEAQGSLKYELPE